MNETRLLAQFVHQTQYADIPTPIIDEFKIFVLDTIGAEVVYEGGKESYRNLTINGKPTKKSPEESGAWSTGEFGTALIDLFHPATAAEFHYQRESRTAGITAKLYDFNVMHDHSHWDVKVGGQS